MKIKNLQIQALEGAKINNKTLSGVGILKIGGGVDESFIGRWAYNLVVPGSSPPPCYSPDLFSVTPSSTLWLRFCI